MDLLPYVVRMISPEVKPIIVGGSGETKGVASVRKESEKRMVKRAVDVMSEIGVVFERGRLEGSDVGAQKWGASEWVYRMEPPLDTLVTFLTSPNRNDATSVRYAVRQVLDQEYQKNIVVRENAARLARFKAGNPDGYEEYSFEKGKFGKGKFEKAGSEKNILGAVTGNEVKRDFFGRVLENRVKGGKDGDVGDGENRRSGKKEEKKVWVTFHEGFSNAVKKPITIAELMRGL